MIVMTAATAKQIAAEMKSQWVIFYGKYDIQCMDMLVDVLAEFADGTTDLYVSFSDDCYTVSSSYIIAEHAARKLFLIEHGIGFDLSELAV